ncbi:MAG: prolyl oligopeptidase family serine peptidase [Bifidobacterium sp.]|nr:prolyl oligopeptidase family serine peptidase [Bifidobacterium sp.]
MKSYSPYENAPFGPWQGDAAAEDESGADAKSKRETCREYSGDASVMKTGVIRDADFATVAPSADSGSDDSENRPVRHSPNATWRYPKIFATTSLNDTRVLYVEPLKWIARLQSQGVDAIVRIEVEAGHGGTSGRYKQWQEVSDENAWCLNAMGIDR